MDISKIFNDLESNNLTDAEEARRKLTDSFSATKDAWLVQGIMDYFGQTNSYRIVDILVKVQQPHDKHIFDRLSEWIRGPNKLLSLTLFGHIVRKHPSWLFRVVNHTYMKELLKLSKTEHDIITLMSGVFCIITLLPIIPALIGSSYLNDLFDVFNYLVTWHCNNSANLSDDILMHLQYGINTMFHRLYGMWPCNFIGFLRTEYVLKDKQTHIFANTIRPLLETVKMHPALVTATKDHETNKLRWKKMEPHDVVMECSKFSLLDYFNDICHNHNHHNENNYHRVTPAAIEFNASVVAATSTTFNTTNISSISAGGMNLKIDNFHKLSNMNTDLITKYADNNTIWSPVDVILATPPPTGTVPHTPTPNYAVPSSTSSQIHVSTTSSASVGNIERSVVSSLNQLNIGGTSPPEAAVEATPETTPMKDMIDPRYPINSQVARAMWPSSQPSSPMKKDFSPFGFPTDTSTALQSSTNTKLISMIQERHYSDMQTQKLKLPANCSVPGVSTSASVPSSPLSINTQQIPKQPPNRSDLEINNDILTQEDQEVIGIYNNKSKLPHQPVSSEVVSDVDIHPTDYVTPQDSIEENDEDMEETIKDGTNSPYSPIGEDSHMPNSRSMINFTQRRLRMVSHCLYDTNSSYSAGTSPADICCGNSLTNFRTARHIHNFKAGGICISSSSNRSVIERPKSWPDLSAAGTNLDTTINTRPRDITKTETVTTLTSVTTTTTETNNNLNGDTSPSDDEAISAATYSQKKQNAKIIVRNNINNNNNIKNNTQKLNERLLKEIRNDLLKNKNILNVGRKSIATQTLELWPKLELENLFNKTMHDEMKMKIFQHQQYQQQLQQQQELCIRESPSKMLDKYIEISVNSTNNNNNRKLISSTSVGNNSNNGSNSNTYYDQKIKLLNLQLQFEKHRREIHAERNRRLLGKSRTMRALEQYNVTLKDQVELLSKEITNLNSQLTDRRKKQNQIEDEYMKENKMCKLKYQSESDDNKQLRATIATLQMRLVEETKQRMTTNHEIDVLRGELFDLKNDMRQALYQAELGQQYRDETTRLQSEMILMGEIQSKCKDKLSELNSLKTRDAEIQLIQESYSEEVNDLKASLETKTSQLERSKKRLNELESQLASRDNLLTEQKRLLKAVKEEHLENYNALESKYAAQKSINLKLEEHILELYGSQYQTAVNLVTVSPESDKTDFVGSLDYTSPLSLSLASSEGLPASLRSVTEIRNLQALVGQEPFNNEMNSSTLSGITGGAGPSAPATISSDIPVPGSSHQQSIHHLHQ